MTLSERNTFFKAGIGFCAVCVLLLLAASFFIVPLYKTDFVLSETESIMAPDFEEHLNSDTDKTPRPKSFFQALTGRFMKTNFYAVHTSLALAVLFSLIGMMLIHHFFERTSAPEILYVAIFTVTLSFEIIRLILPLRHIIIFPSFYVVITSRTLLFVRFFGVFSLFAASICAAGLEAQKTRNIIFIIIIAALVITLGIPIDVLNWDTSLNIVNGYESMFRMIDLAIFVTTMVSFLIASRIRESKEYTYVAAGIMLALIGRNILLNTDNWIGPVLGIVLLSYGTWFLCTKLHKIHLWL